MFGLVEVWFGMVASGLLYFSLVWFGQSLIALVKFGLVEFDLVFSVHRQTNK